QISHDGRLIAYAAGRDSPDVYLWDRRGRRFLRTLATLWSGGTIVGPLSWSEDEAWLLVGQQATEWSVRYVLIEVASGTKDTVRDVPNPGRNGGMGLRLFSGR